MFFFFFSISRDSIMNNRVIQRGSFKKITGGGLWGVVEGGARGIFEKIMSFLYLATQKNGGVLFYDEVR